MKSISTPPGAYKFRLPIIVTIIVVLMAVFLDYANTISIKTEQASIRQTSNVINSSLAIVFATFVVRGEQHRLNQLNGKNPFNYLSEYNLLPPNYQGEVDLTEKSEIEAGWYYDKQKKAVAFKSNYEDKVYYFTVVLDFVDKNGNGRFEQGTDVYRRLLFRELTTAMN